MTALDLTRRADRLAAFRDMLVDGLADMADQLEGPDLADVREAARPWLRCLDRATGTEDTETIEGTIERLKALAVAAANRGPLLAVISTRLCSPTRPMAVHRHVPLGRGIAPGVVHPNRPQRGAGRVSKGEPPQSGGTDRRAGVPSAQIGRTTTPGGGD